MKEINLLTYNTFQKPIGVNGVPNEFKSERLDLFCKHYLSLFDVLALQECFDSTNTRPYELLRRAHRQGFKYFVCDPNPSFFSKSYINGGLMILSKLPILNSEHVSFPQNVAADVPMEKGVLWAEIELPGSSARLHLFNTHLQAYFAKLHSRKQVDCHMRRVEQLVVVKDFMRRILAKHFRPGDAAFLCGDLNVNALNFDFPFEEVMAQFPPVRPEEKDRLRTSDEFEFYRRVLEFRQTEFKVCHVFHEDQGSFPPTCGHYVVDERGDKVARETLITHIDDQFDNAALDYILELRVSANDGTHGSKRPLVKKGSAKVEEFLIEHPQLTQLSDHYGISLKIAL